jgi:hypothetical protein
MRSTGTVVGCSARSGLRDRSLEIPCFTRDEENTVTKQLPLALLILAVSTFGGAVRADSDSEKLHELERQILALQARIAALEAHQSFASFMPNVAERFHVMHHAGVAGDWAVAAHELQELKRLSSLSSSIDAEKGSLMQAMMEPSFEALQSAIEHGNGEKFGKALTQTVDTCNACHSAVGSEFVEVTLEVPSLLSLRHPHKLSPRAVPADHRHEMPAARRDMKGMKGDAHSGMKSGDHEREKSHTH